jgi:hypothetical protein
MADYVYRLVHYIFVSGCRFDNLDHFINFMSIEASINPSVTPTLDADGVAKSLDSPYSSLQSCIRSQIVQLWRA